MKSGPSLDIAIPDILNLTTFYLEENVARGGGDKTAVIYGEKRLTFNDLCAVSNRVGNVLKEFGVGFEDRVLLILQDSPDWLSGWFATMKVGGVATHAYTYLLPSDYEYFLNYVRPKVVIADNTTLERVRQGASNSAFPGPILVAGEHLPPLKKGEHSLKALSEKTSSTAETAPTTKNDLAFWNFSGGTTGKQKGVPHMHHHGVLGFESFQYVVHYTSEDIVLRVPKLFFHYSRDLGMNWPLRAGAAVCLFPERTTAEVIFELIAQHKPTVLVNVPTMMRSMLKSPLAKDADLRCLRFCISSGELLSAQLYKDFTETFGVEVINSHGSAEMYLASFVDRPGEVKPGASGKITPLVEVKLVDGAGNEVPQGETGVLLVRSDASGWCYHMEHEKSKATFLGNDWVNTNDLFREDEDGYFWYAGRGDDLIKVSGVYVAPLEIEKCLGEHPAVRECVVLGLKDGDGLDKTKAFIALNQGFEASDQMAEELKEHCKQKMASFKTPRLIEFLPELPKTGQGKVDKRELLERKGS